MAVQEVLEPVQKMEYVKREVQVGTQQVEVSNQHHYGGLNTSYAGGHVVGGGVVGGNVRVGGHVGGHVVGGARAGGAIHYSPNRWGGN